MGCQANQFERIARNTTHSTCIWVFDVEYRVLLLVVWCGGKASSVTPFQVSYNRRYVHFEVPQLFFDIEKSLARVFFKFPELYQYRSSVERVKWRIGCPRGAGLRRVVWRAVIVETHKEGSTKHNNTWSIRFALSFLWNTEPPSVYIHLPLRIIPAANSPRRPPPPSTRTPSLLLRMPTNHTKCSSLP